MTHLVDGRGAEDGDAPRLRLVVGGRTDAVDHHRDSALAVAEPHGAAERRRIVEPRRWALANGRPMETRALVVLFGTMDDDELIDRVPPTLWTETRVLEFVWTTALFWCQENDIDPPAGLTETLESWFTYMDETNGFAAGSDDVDVLLSALTSCTTTTHTRRRRRSRTRGAS